MSFPSASPATFFAAADAARPARAVEGRGRLFRPAGAAGRRPAVVILPGLGGIVEYREPRYGRLLAARGYVALACDSFGQRGLGHAPLIARVLGVTEAMLAADAYAALAHLAARSDVDAGVDAGRVALVGFSYGAFAVVLCAYAQVARAVAPENGPRFAAHASLYGSTVARLADPTTTGAPVLMLTGDRDRNVDLEHVHQVADDPRRGGSRVDLRVYPGVCHQWDGNEARPTPIRPSPHRLRFRMSRDGSVHDPRTGLTIADRRQRAAALLAGADWGGYTLRRDEAALARSDAALLDLLAAMPDGAEAGPTPPRT